MARFGGSAASPRHTTVPSGVAWRPSSAATDEVPRQWRRRGGAGMLVRMLGLRSATWWRALRGWSLAIAAAACSAPTGRTAPAAVPPRAAAPEPSPAVAPSTLAPHRVWPVPAGWRAETLALPASFAPSMAQHGVEELRFSPGMFDPSAPDYWTYAFVWWLEELPGQDATSLATDLTAYFRGLLGEVATERAAAPGDRPPPAPFRLEDISASLRATGVRARWDHFEGEVTVFDAFGDGRPLRLMLRVAQRVSVSAQRRAVLVLASPQPYQAPGWSQLEDVGMAFAGRMPR